MISIFKKQTFIRLSIVVIALLMFSSCVYFNTFYNAKLFFSEAQKLRVKQENEFLGNNITDKYKKVIEKSDIVINNHPDSKYLIDALFLKGRSHYYRREYDLSESTFKTLLLKDDDDYNLLSEYWLALNKWKSGKPQPALEDLNQIISKTDNRGLLAQIYQSQAEIYLEQKQDSVAVSALEKAAKLTKNRNDKANIYYRLAELAYEIQNYESAIDYYKSVIKYSFSNEQVMEVNLKIVQRYRDLNDLKKASKEIQSMLNDPEYSTIHGELELELAKLKLDQKNIKASILILEDIVVKYPKTDTSAEAFYLLGEQSLLNRRDFEKADFYYKQIQRESSKSIFNEQGRLRIRELDKYNSAKEFIKDIDNKENTVDSLATEYVVDTSKVVGELYHLGELEAFHFNQIDSSIIYFDRIINDFPNSDLNSKSMYTLSHLYEQIEDTSKSLFYKEQVVNNYSDSEYAENIRLNDKNMDYGTSSIEMLSNIEYLYPANSDSALSDYKIIANLSNSEASKRALLFIANEYDYKLFNPDSAQKYYNQIVDRFPKSDQAEIANSRLRQFSKNDSKNNGESIVNNEQTEIPDAVIKDNSVKTDDPIVKEKAIEIIKSLENELSDSTSVIEF